MAAALLYLTEPRTLTEVATHVGRSLSATRLLLGHMIHEGRVVPDGSGGYTLHPRERYRQESRRRALDDLARRLAAEEVERIRRQPGPIHVRTQGYVNANDVATPKRIGGEDD